jgi:hypothetical protein
VETQAGGYEIGGEAAREAVGGQRGKTHSAEMSHGLLLRYACNMLRFGLKLARTPRLLYTLFCGPKKLKAGPALL